MNYERETSKKIDRAIKLLKSIPSDDIEVCFSGGKDSSVILELAKMAGIKLNPIYYDREGKIDVAKRLGCMCCPLAGLKKLQAYFDANPRMVKLYIRNGLIWWNRERKKELASVKIYTTIYDIFFQNVFCYNYQEYLEKKHGLFGDLDCKRFLEEHFKIKLD